MKRSACRGLLGAMLLLCLGPAPSFADEGDSKIEFLAPRPSETVIGAGTIELLVRVAAPLTAQKVAVLVDGARFATLTGPPWRTSWDAGDALEPHLLEAVLHLSNGAQIRTSVRTAALRIDQYEQVSLVNLYAIVRDAKGAYVGGLTRDDFRVTENGRPQTISRFSDEWKPLRIAIVLDTSLSMQGDKLDAAREAARSFLEVLRPEDQGLVVLFHDSVDVVQPLTSARSELEAAIGKARAKGGTALYDAIWRTADLLDSIEGRRVIVLLSDGRDEAASGLEPGSLHTQEEALDRALRAETMIFSIGFGRNPATEWDFFRRRSLESILRELSEATGGRSLFSSRAGKLRKAFEQVADDLRHQYSLAYTSDDPRRDGSWRGIQVTSARPDLRVVSRQGYFAPKDKTAPKAPTKKR